MTDHTDTSEPQAAGHQFTRPGQVGPDRPAPDRCMVCGESAAVHALRAVLEALDIPHPATVGDGEVYDKILAERVTHSVIFLQNFLRDGGTRPEWALGYFREKLAGHPATGYRTWGEAVAEMHAREQAALEVPAAGQKTRAELRAELARLRHDRETWEQAARSCTCPAPPGQCTRGGFRDHAGQSEGCTACADLDPDQPCYAAVAAAAARHADLAPDGEADPEAGQ